jgi:hypothetical protein
MEDANRQLAKGWPGMSEARTLDFEARQAGRVDPSAGGPREAAMTRDGGRRDGPGPGGNPQRPSSPGRRDELTTAAPRPSDEPSIGTPTTPWRDDPAVGEGAGSTALAGLGAADDAAAQSRELGADLSRLTPLVVEHQATVTVSPQPLSAPAAEAKAAHGTTVDGVPADEVARDQPKPGFGERLANTAMALFVLGFTAFLAGAAVATAVLLGLVKTAWIKDALRGLKDVAMQLADLVK